VRKSILLLTLFLFAVLVQAQPPPGISYQAVARNAQGQVLSNTPIKLRFSILNSTAVGAALYTETQEPVTSARTLPACGGFQFLINELTVDGFSDCVIWLKA
jgi:hypothetical protein